MSKLEDILQNEITTEIAAIQGAGEAKAKAIVAAAMEKAEALKASKSRQLEAENAAALRRAESAAELLLNQARIAARGRAVDQVKSGVQKELTSLVGQASFGDVLKRLADEAIKSVGKAESVVVNPAHLSLLEGWAKAQGLRLESSPAVQNGVRVVAEGSKSFVQNALGERLERSWDALSARAAKAIWG
ncbi:MAG: V-type ATP synthase subunit E [Meiothermus sp.]|nr:V-type ATP synthase subunit E [Meiothermus sp.]